MKILQICAVALVLCLGLTGCLSSPIALVPSTDPMQQGRYSVVGEEVSGTDTQLSVLFFTFGAHGSGIRRAINDALSYAPGADALVRVAVEEEYFSLILFSFNKVRITGTPVKAN